MARKILCIQMIAGNHQQVKFAMKKFIMAKQMMHAWKKQAGYCRVIMIKIGAVLRLPDFSFDNLIATENEPVRKHETFKPVHIFTTPKGEHVIDFGQNLVGWIVLKVKGNAGDTITVSHAEVLDKNGNFYTDNLRAAKAQDKYILKGDDEETFEPHFTWHGFRYAKIEGMHGDLKPENFTAVALYSDMQPTGTFHFIQCLNQSIAT